MIMTASPARTTTSTRRRVAPPTLPAVGPADPGRRPRPPERPEHPAGSAGSERDELTQFERTLARSRTIRPPWAR